MKIPILCAQCVRENPKDKHSYSFAYLRDDGLYSSNCSKGHISSTVLQQEKFEILFEIGANAIVDGYYREAISAFLASMEGFQEYYIKVICLRHNIISDALDETFRKLKNLSERQLGAFAITFLLENAKVPPFLSEDLTNLRNKVIHRGRIPLREEAIKFGDAIYSIIVPILRRLKSEYKTEVEKMTRFHINELAAKAPNRINTATLYYPTILSLSQTDSSLDKTFNEIFPEFEKRAISYTSRQTSRSS